MQRDKRKIFPTHMLPNWAQWDRIKILESEYRKTLKKSLVHNGKYLLYDTGDFT